MDKIKKETVSEHNISSSKPYKTEDEGKQRKPLSQCNFVNHKSHAWTGMRSDTGFRGESKATDCSNHGTAVRKRRTIVSLHVKMSGRVTAEICKVHHLLAAIIQLQQAPSPSSLLYDCRTTYSCVCRFHHSNQTSYVLKFIFRNLEENVVGLWHLSRR